MCKLIYFEPSTPALSYLYNGRIFNSEHFILNFFMLKKFQVFMNSRHVSSHLCEFVYLRQFDFFTFADRASQYIYPSN